ncbi:MAG: type II toxin-antitoxin system VapC family toxin [Candidatus Woesearchaeota archaeon]
MKDILKNAPILQLSDKVDFLFDTCFLVWVFKHKQEKKLSQFLEKHTCAITSFTLEEFTHIHIPTKILQDAKKFFKTHTIPILEVAPHIGEWENEKQFVTEIMPELAKEEHDLSDAVLLAAAIRTNASVLTRDKHDIFNAHIEKFLDFSKTKIYNTFID